MYRYAMGQSLEHSIKYLHTALSNIVATGHMQLFKLKLFKMKFKLLVFQSYYPHFKGLTATWLVATILSS